MQRWALPDAGTVTAGQAVQVVLSYDIGQSGFQTLLSSAVMVTTSGKPAAKVPVCSLAPCCAPVFSCTLVCGPQGGRVFGTPLAPLPHVWHAVLCMLQPPSLLINLLALPK